MARLTVLLKNGQDVFRERRRAVGGADADVRADGRSCDEDRR